jgi:hypothetical protein
MYSPRSSRQARMDTLAVPAVRKLARLRWIVLLVASCGAAGHGTGRALAKRKTEPRTKQLTGIETLAVAAPLNQVRTQAMRSRDNPARTAHSKGFSRTRIPICSAHEMSTSSPTGLQATTRQARQPRAHRVLAESCLHAFHFLELRCSRCQWNTVR